MIEDTRTLKGSPTGRALRHAVGSMGSIDSMRRASVRSLAFNAASARLRREGVAKVVSDYKHVSYQTAVSGWHDFYILSGTAAATLVGLLFVGLSLHLRVVIASSEVRSLARITLANFGAVLFVALFMVIPEGPSTAGLQLIASGVASLVIITPSLVTAAQSRGRTLQMRGRDRVRLVLRFGLSSLSYVGVIVAGALLPSSFASAFIWLLVAIVVLLVVSLRNTWDLLVTVGDVTFGRERNSN
jgi:hypothetical protein